MSIATRPNPVAGAHRRPRPETSPDRQPGKRRQADATAPKRQHNWDWRAAANFIGGGAGGGLLAATALAAFAGGDLRALVLIGMALVGIGLTCVWFEIGRPWRALNVYRHFATSWMTREALLAPVLFASGIVAVINGQSAYFALAGLFGFAFLYAQARMLAADKGIPAWRHPRCLPLVVTTGLAEGAGLLALAAPLLLPTAVRPVALVLLVALTVRAALWKWYLDGLRRDRVPKGSLRAFEGIAARLMVASHIVPGALVLGAGIGLPGAGTLLGGAALLGVCGGWWLKYTLVCSAAFTPGFALPHIPVRGRAPAASA